MLTGIPGCGKSSTILSIASYLSKDIYYFDLGKIKTNNELKLCIDYIKTNSSNDGLIIMEDIDCMTHIVKSRSNFSDISDTITQSMNSMTDALSLSFLLNIIDGTMSLENIIFIFTTNHKDMLDPALIRPGRMDISLNLEKCSKYQLQQMYVDMYGEQLDESLVNRFRENTYITSEIILHLFHDSYNKDISPEKLLHNFLD